MAQGAKDPGLEKTPFRDPSGKPYVGRAHQRIERFSKDPVLEDLLSELRAGFGPQYWWPADTAFEVMVGCVLTQNTAWRNVEMALANLRSKKLLTPGSILSSDPVVLEEGLRPSGYFRAKTKKLCALSRWYLDVGGLRALTSRPLEDLRSELLAVHGVGPETADSILCYGAGRRTVVIDTYTRRLLSRHGLAAGDESYETLRQSMQKRLVDSQAVYEEFHALCVRVGYSGCKPKPRCEDCPVTTPVELRGPNDV